jgi:hypothetical protein
VGRELLSHTGRVRNKGETPGLPLEGVIGCGKRLARTVHDVKHARAGNSYLLWYHYASYMIMNIAL